MMERSPHPQKMIIHPIVELYMNRMDSDILHNARLPVYKKVPACRALNARMLRKLFASPPTHIGIIDEPLHVIRERFTRTIANLEADESTATEWLREQQRSARANKEGCSDD